MANELQTQVRQRAIATLSNEKVMAALKSVSTKHLTADRVVKIMVGEFSKNPKLAECSGTSLVLCALSFAQLGLEPGLLGQAYMVPRMNKGTLEAQFQLGYKGKITLAYRSGMYESIYADVVFQDDQFEYEYGSNGFIRHIPNHTSGHRADNDIVAAYAIAVLKGSTHPIFRVVPRVEIDETRRRSAAKDSGPWVTDFDQMARKTAVHRLAPYLPMNTEMAVAHAIDEKADRGELAMADFGEVSVEDAIVTPTHESNGGTAGLKNKLNVPQEA